MAETVVPLDLGVDWDPNSDDCFLIHDGGGGTATLVIDSNWARGYDRRVVQIAWRHARLVTFGAPNDEAIHGHRLYGSGLSDVYRSGVVEDSELIRMLQRENRVHPRHDARRFDALTHYVLLLRGAVLEVVAEDVVVTRPDGSLAEAARSLIL